MNEKIMPYDISAEEAVIGSLLIDGEAIHKINSLETQDFYHEPTRMAYEACRVLSERREDINQISVAQELARQDKLELCGGAAYLSHLVSIIPTSLDIENFANVVKRLYVSRQSILLAARIAQVGYDAEPDSNTGINKISAMVSDFQRANVAFNDIVTPSGAAGILGEMWEEYQNPQHAFSWGFVDMDEITSGIFPELIIIGARPGVGKTELMLNIAESFIGKTVLFCSVEMSIKSLLERKVARSLEVDIKQLRRGGSLGEEEEGKLMDLIGQVSEQPIYYLPKGSSSQDVYNEAKKMKETVGLDIVFVDYLQLLRDCWQDGKETQNVRVGKACKVLKSLVNDLQIPVILASQLNRSLEYRAEKRPTLADLRDSGEIEQDADVVFLGYRDEEQDDILEVKMAKNRQLGTARAIYLQWVAHRHCYANKAVPSPYNDGDPWK